MANEIYVADFETTTDENDCRVWAWAITHIDNPEKVTTGNSIESFIQLCKTLSGIVYFHNEKFDGSFILDFLFRCGYTWTENKRSRFGKERKLEPGTFTTLISDMGVWYTLKVCFKDSKNTIEIRDSLKLIPLPVEKIPAAFGLNESKGSIDYKEYRAPGHELTEKEINYIKGDVIIVASALSFMISNGETKMTAASNALNDYKNRIGKKQFNRWFPKLNYNVDADIRHSYKGGWTYLNPLYTDKPTGNGSVYDVNSMYPWAMKYCQLPYGEPIYFRGPPRPDTLYKLYVVQFIATFKLKPNKYPSIQVKHTMWYSDNMYIEESKGPTLLTLTSIDYELFIHNYDVDIYEWQGGYYFKARSDMFVDYIDYWYDKKTEAKKTGNAGLAQIAKLKLNSLYGKFGARLDGRSKIPWFDTETDKVRYRMGEPEQREGVYIPVATFITSYCRDKIIRASEACYDRFIYADTDSIHINGTEPVTGIEVDDYKLGAFKLESTFIRARFVRQKTYIEINQREVIDYDGYTYTEPVFDIKCAGMPYAMKQTVDESDFYLGAKFPIGPDSKFAPKLSPKVVPGGVILREMPFKIH